MTKRHEMFIELFNNGSHQAYEETRTKAIWDNDHIEISSESSIKTFYHLEEVIRIAQGLNLKSYAKAEDGKVKIIVF